jgi:amidase
VISPLDNASTLAHALREKEISSRELLDAYLSRIDALNPALNAVVTLDVSGARAEAARLDDLAVRGEFRGPLHGLPCTIKDAIAVGGMRSTGGALEYSSYVPDADAPAVAMLRAAGAVVFGKTNVPRWSADYQTYNDVFGTTNNPWDLTRTPGGSSGGAAAAVAAGLTAFELGTDIGGSIRVPAAFCGIAGHKPSYGIVPDRGYLHYVGSGTTATDISVLGPLARSVGDLAMLLDVLAGPVPRDAAAWSLQLPPAASGPWRVGTLFTEPDCRVRSDVYGVLHEAARTLSLDGSHVADSHPDVTFAETMATYGPLVNAAISPQFAGELGTRFGGSHVAWLRHQDARERLRRRWSAWFADFDVLLMPAYPVPAFVHDTAPPLQDRTVDIDGYAVGQLTCAQWLGHAGVVDLPATVVRIGTSREGLPVGVQVVGRYLGDRTALAVASRLESLCGGYVAPPIAV